jgi:hypothetical protein
MYAVVKDAYTNAGKKLPESALHIHQLSELPGLIERVNTEAAQVDSR